MTVDFTTIVIQTLVMACLSSGSSWANWADTKKAWSSAQSTVTSPSRSEIDGNIIEGNCHDVYGNPLLFQKRNCMSETGLYYFRAMYYSPALGRFLSHDPNGFADSMNLYQYCLENPINLSDPNGESPLLLAILGGAAIAMWIYNATHVDLETMTRSEDFSVKEQLLWGAGGGAAGAVGYGAAAYAGGYLAIGGKSLGEIAAGSGASAWASTAALGALGGATGGLTFQGTMDLGHWEFSGIGAYAEAAGSGALIGGVAAPLRKAAGIVFNEVAPKSGQSSRILGRTNLQLQKKFKHATDFGVKGNYNKANVARFSEAIHKHINSPGVREIVGKYRGNPAVHFLDPKTGLNVVTDPAGNFVTGFRLSGQQLKDVLTRGWMW